MRGAGETTVRSFGALTVELTASLERYLVLASFVRLSLTDTMMLG